LNSSIDSVNDAAVRAAPANHWSHPKAQLPHVQLERIKDWSAAEDGDDSALQTIEKLARFEQRLRD